MKRQTQQRCCTTAPVSVRAEYCATLSERLDTVDADDDVGTGIVFALAGSGSEGGGGRGRTLRGESTRVTQYKDRYDDPASSSRSSSDNTQGSLQSQ